LRLDFWHLDADEIRLRFKSRTGDVGRPHDLPNAPRNIARVMIYRVVQTPETERTFEAGPPAPAPGFPRTLAVLVIAGSHHRAKGPSDFVRRRSFAILSSARSSLNRRWRAMHPSPGL
jgi:hypothetical protein